MIAPLGVPQSRALDELKEAAAALTLVVDNINAGITLDHFGGALVRARLRMLNAIEHAGEVFSGGAQW